MGIFGKLKRIADIALQDSITVSTEKSSYGKFVVLDVETTGLSPDQHRVIELALITVQDGNILETWSSRFNPEGPVGKTEIHGITEEDVEDAPKFHEIADEVIARITSTALIAHNARFDLAFLRSEFEKSDWKVPWLSSICTLEASHYYQPYLSRRRLRDCCEDIGINIENAHSASGDALATAKLISYYLNSNKRPKPRMADLEIINSPNSSKFSRGLPSKDRIHIQERVAVQKPTSTSHSNTSYQALVKLLAACSISDVIGSDLPLETTQYVEKLVEALEDGLINETETSQLAAIAKIYALNESQIDYAHKALLKALAKEALKDESISVSERQELVYTSKVLGLPEKVVTEIIKQAKESRSEELSRNLPKLPTSWKLGDPLRVGDKVVFTGCDPEQRARLEKDSVKQGVTISSGVSKKTTLLVTDGSYVGNKANDADRLGVRRVSPDEYELMLKYIQPVK